MKSIKLEEAPEELQKAIQMDIKLNYKLLSIREHNLYNRDGVGYQAFLFDGHWSYRILTYEEGLKLIEDRISIWTIKDLMRIDPKLCKEMKSTIEILEMEEKEQSE